jgi:hypothetical protein
MSAQNTTRHSRRTSLRVKTENALDVIVRLAHKQGLASISVTDDGKAARKFSIHVNFDREGVVFSRQDLSRRTMVDVIEALSTRGPGEFAE